MKLYVGSTGTTATGLTRNWNIVRHRNTLLNRSIKWLDFGGALQSLKTELKELKLLESEGKSIHEHPSQLKRQARAASRKCAPETIDRERKFAVFTGSNGTKYTTTTETCTCRDFILRHYPCKHIYRLLSELGEFKLTPSKSDFIDADMYIPEHVDPLSNSAKQELECLLGSWIHHLCYDEWVYARQEPHVAELLEAGIVEEFSFPERLLERLKISELRIPIKEHGLKCPRTKVETIRLVIEKFPEVVEKQLKSFMVVRIPERLRPIRGKIRNYLRSILPEPEMVESPPESYAYYLDQPRSHNVC